MTFPGSQTNISKSHGVNRKGFLILAGDLELGEQQVGHIASRASLAGEAPRFCCVCEEGSQQSWPKAQAPGGLLGVPFPPRCLFPSDGRRRESGKQMLLEEGRGLLPSGTPVSHRSAACLFPGPQELVGIAGPVCIPVHLAKPMTRSQSPLGCSSSHQK